MRKFISALAVVVLVSALCFCLTSCGRSKVDYSKLSFGDKVNFGDYECRVLEVQDGKVLLITNEIVAEKGFYRIQNDPEHPNSYTTTNATVWAESTLRDYLNSEFYSAFDDESRARILKTTVKNDDFEPGNYYSVDAGPDTEDYIFCPSMDEAYNYFDGLEDRAANSAKGVESDWWWLRTPGKGHNHGNGTQTYYFQFVNAEGEVQEYGNGVQYEIGVRPAFWIDTTADAQ